MISGWEILEEGGVIHRTGPGSDLVTVQTYTDFDLSLEWKISVGGNSGILFRVGDGHKETYETGPEFQILDDTAFPSETQSHLAGALFDLYEPENKTLRPVGEWNDCRIRSVGTHVDHWLNGVLVVTFDIFTKDWNQRVANSKFSSWKSFATSNSGRIALQNHGYEVWFRNITIHAI